MKSAHLGLLISYAFGMAVGQILLKQASMACSISSQIPLIKGLIGNGWLWAGLILYALLMLLWIWILSFIPLNRAYPFVMLSLVFTPMLSWMLFHERLTLGYFCGVALIMGGLVVIVHATHGVSL